MKKIISLLLVCVLSLTALCSCTAVADFINTAGQQPEAEEGLSVEYVYFLAQAEGYTGTLADFIEEFKGESGADGKDGVGIASAAFDESSHLILTLTNGKTIDCGKVTVDISASSTISIGENGNWYINGEDTGKKAEAKDSTEWHTGAGAPLYSLGKDGDLYFNTNNNDVYKRIHGVWSVIANLSGNDVTVNEGDKINVTINSDGASSIHAASKALLSAVRIEAVFAPSNPILAHASNGSGVIYKLDKNSGDAYVITNYHVVFGTGATGGYEISSNISLYLYGMEYTDYRIPAVYVGGSMNYDIAVLKVTDSELLRTTHVEAADIADSAKVSVLETAIAVGNPASAGIAVTKGSVNVLSEEIDLVGADNKTLVQYRVMRMDTPVNSGNSGGGLFNGKGDLIGIVSAKETEDGIENMGYAIPSNLVVAVAENIIRNCNGTTKTSVIKCVLGISISIGEIERVYDSETGKLEVIETCIVYDINTGSVAEVALSKNDRLISFEIDGRVFEINHIYDGSEALLYATPTSEVYVNYERGGVPGRARLYLTADNFSTIK